MDGLDMALNGGNKELATEPMSFARSYQVEALEKAMKQNTIVFLETGSGKTLIAIMLLRNYAHLLRKPSPFISVFLVPTVVLVTQQAEAIAMHTDLKVGKYWGEMGVDFWDAATWKKQEDNCEVLVMTPVILLDALRHSFLKLEMIKVLIFDECHNARGKHPYACIMREFYHRLSLSKSSELPRVFGMTASPIKAKGSSSELAYWKEISDLENLMNSKVYTCISESVLAEYIPFATPKLMFYDHVDIPLKYVLQLENDLARIKVKYETSLEESRLPESMVESGKKKLSRVYSNFRYCIDELGIWSALKAAESLSCTENDIFLLGELDSSSENAVRKYCLDATEVFASCIPLGIAWSITCDKEAYVNSGYLSSKAICLLECLHAYRDVKDLRCIIFVRRIITAFVLKSILNELLSERKIECMAGNNSKIQSQSRKEQNYIVEEFRKGTVNIIVATSILEEGLDVQSCNLVIRFDPSATICSFIQSRGRARKQNSDFIIMIKNRDASTLTRVKNYLASGELMRKESLRHSSLPCEPLNLSDEIFYQVEATGAMVTLASSIALLNYYCSHLPSDGYFKPYPRIVIDKELQVCTLYLPKSAPISTIKVEGNVKLLKKLACLEACKQLHQIGALTDNLVPDIVEEESNDQESGFEYNTEQVQYLPPELISDHNDESETLYYCYVLKLYENFKINTQLRDLLLLVTSKFDIQEEFLSLDFNDDNNSVMVSIKYVDVITLTSEQVSKCRRFQVTLLSVLLNHSSDKMDETLRVFDRNSSSSALFDYLLLPSTTDSKIPSIDWKSVCSVPLQSTMECLCDQTQSVHTKSGLVCSCKLKDSLVCTPHNNYVYNIYGTSDRLFGNSTLNLRKGEDITYKSYYETRHGICLEYEEQSLLHGKHIPIVQNYLLKCRTQKTKVSISKGYVNLPPEICLVIMSPISRATIDSFSYVPSIMHRIESLLLAFNLKKMHLDLSTVNVNIPTIKVLEAITTKKCQETFHLESLETLGDSFLKYVATLHLFQAYPNDHEGLLTIKRQKIISNTTLCKLGCDRKIPGFIRDEAFDPITWIIPGDKSVDHKLEEHELSPMKKVYSIGTREVNSKTVADVVEALIGAYLSAGGEKAALSFMEWLGMKIDLVIKPCTRSFPVSPELHVNLRSVESLLDYSFQDASFLVEALTHGSYMLPDIPGCYQRLEFLGDSVLDYLITVHLYYKYPGLSPGLLTDLRSASVNNDCYAQAALKARLHKHILHTSQELQKQLTMAINEFDNSFSPSTFGWENETNLPKVLGDIIESLAGAIFVDSKYDKGLVFQCMRPLLEPLVTPDTLRFHPVRELLELCQKEHYTLNKPVVTRENGEACVMMEVKANGVTYRSTRSSPDKRTAKKLACKGLLELMAD